MTCKQCGTEIADKALICYRCGAPTTEPVRPSAASSRGAVSPVLAAVGLVVLMLAALFMGRAGELQIPPAMSYAVSALAALLLGWRMWSRRRR